MTDWGMFAAGFIVGGVLMGVLVPLLFMWRADDEPEVTQTIYFEDLGSYHIALENEPSVRAGLEEYPTSETSEGQGGGSG